MIRYNDLDIATIGNCYPNPNFLRIFLFSCKANTIWTFRFVIRVLVVVSLHVWPIFAFWVVDLNNNLAHFLHKFVAFSVCLSAYKAFSHEGWNIHFWQLPTNGHVRNPNFSTKTPLSDSFAIIGQSFSLLFLTDAQEEGHRFVFDCHSKLHTIYGIIDSSSGDTFFWKWFTIFFHFSNRKFDPFSKSISLGLI